MQLVHVLLLLTRLVPDQMQRRLEGAKVLTHSPESRVWCFVASLVNLMLLPAAEEEDEAS